MGFIMNISRLTYATIAITVSTGGVALAESRETIIHNFSVTTEKTPKVGPVIDASTGIFYGTTLQGGKNGAGTVYQMIPPTVAHPKWTYMVIYNNPGNSKLVSAGDYIFASNGIVYGGGYGGGSVLFSLTPPKTGVGDWAPTVLYAFTGGSDGGDTDSPLTRYFSISTERVAPPIWVTAPDLPLRADWCSAPPAFSTARPPAGAAVTEGWSSN